MVNPSFRTQKVILQKSRSKFLCRKLVSLLRRESMLQSPILGSFDHFLAKNIGNVREKQCHDFFTRHKLIGTY
jgi:hypothetical protein